MNAWTQSKEQDFSSHTRGWKAGVSRKHPSDIRSRILNIRETLENDPDEYYTGDLAIQQRYTEQFPMDPHPSLDYINDILRSAGKVKQHHKRRRGTARYLCYPVACVTRLGDYTADVDFIGHKFIKGVREPLHFLSVAYRNPVRLRCIQRTKGETADEAIVMTNRVFDDLGWPEAVKTDMGTPFTGRIERRDGVGARSVPQYAFNLLRHKTIPVYGNPRSPWNQGTGEGSNSVFGRNFWEHHDFTSIEMVDERIAAFNMSSKKYAEWRPWIRETKETSFIPRICFIRKVGEDARGKKGIIIVASETVSLPKEYIGLFVFSEWHLKEQKLKIFFEQEGVIQQIEEKHFLIHPRSKERCITLLSS